MKPINKYRRSNYFNLTGVDVEALADLRAWLKSRHENLIAVVPSEGAEGEIGAFTIRIARPDLSTWDVRVMRPGIHFEVLEETCIFT